MGVNLHGRMLSNGGSASCRTLSLLARVTLANPIFMCQARGPRACVGTRAPRAVGPSGGQIGYRRVSTGPVAWWAAIRSSSVWAKYLRSTVRSACPISRWRE
jgi:hypothetical protein